MKKINDNELKIIFQGIRNGNREDIGLLYNNYHSIVYGVAFSILKNKENSEDVTQNVFTKILKMDPSLLPTQGEASWLYVVTKNEVMQFLRKQKIVVDIDDMYTLESESNEIDDLVDMTAYYKLLEGLKPIDKEIISLRILSDMTFEKISQMLNMPIGTVEWRYYKALHYIKASATSLVALVLVFTFGDVATHISIPINELEKEYDSIKEYTHEKNGSSSKRNNSIQDDFNGSDSSGGMSYYDINPADSIREGAKDSTGTAMSTQKILESIITLSTFVICAVLLFMVIFFAFKSKIKRKK